MPHRNCSCFAIVSHLQANGFKVIVTTSSYPPLNTRPPDRHRAGAQTTPTYCSAILQGQALNHLPLDCGKRGNHHPASRDTHHKNGHAHHPHPWLLPCRTYHQRHIRYSRICHQLSHVAQDCYFTNQQWHQVGCHRGRGSQHHQHVQAAWNSPHRQLLATSPVTMDLHQRF